VASCGAQTCLELKPRLLFAPHPGGGVAVLASLTAPATEVLVGAGERVEKGQPLTRIEAMKMDLGLNSPVEGRVEQFLCRPGEVVQARSLLSTTAPKRDSLKCRELSRAGGLCMNDTRGWDTIAAAIAGIYGGREPDFHFGVVQSWNEGGNDPLDGISVYRTDDYWHFVSFGLSELYEKESPYPEVSGYGFEMTWRLRRDAAESEPPTWPMQLMQRIARFVIEKRHPFVANTFINLKSPLGGQETRLSGVVFVPDPQLPEKLSSPNGKFSMLQLIGVTAEELDSVEGDDCSELVGRLRSRDPLLVTDLRRSA
jgi:hypothetical protein